MSSISGSMSSAAMMSPNDRMKLALQSAVSTGSVKSTDQSALSSALDDIDAAMKSSGPPAAGTNPSSMKTKVDGLIDQEVSDGKLTSDQATELKSVFAQAASKMGGHHHHAGGPPPTEDSSSSDGTTTAGTIATDATASTDSTKSAIDQLISFLQTLEKSVSSSSTYGSTGTSTASASTSTSMLIDQLA